METVLSHLLKSLLDRLPESGYIRQADLIGAREVTDAQAALNRERGRGPKRPRPARVGLVPMSSATWWRLVARGDAPAPVKLSPGVTAWSVNSIRKWLSERAEGDAS